MSELWLVLGICLVLVLGAAIPLIRERGVPQAPPIPRPETLRDWRKQK
jgi:hypothetical protein